MCIRVLQGVKMNCPKASFEDFVLWCCPEGTYAERGGRLLSFSKDPRPECALPSATMTEDTGGSAVGLWVSLALSVLLTLIVLLCCRACRNQKKEERRRKRKAKKRKKNSQKRKEKGVSWLESEKRV